MYYWSLFFIAVLPSAVSCDSLTRSEATSSYKVSAVHNEPPPFCRVLSEQEINVGDPYTITVELMNLIGEGNDINHGHPGVFYNVVNENNFDFVYFRFVKKHGQESISHITYICCGAIRARSVLPFSLDEDF